jgi:apolipoprotein N-acyltransferase
VSGASAVAAPGPLLRLAAAAAGGVLYALGYLGWGAWPCLLLFLAPLWWAFATGPIRVATAAGLGFVFGFAAFAGGHLWLLALIGPYLDGRWTTGAALWIVYGTWFALAFALYGALFQLARARGGPFALAAIAPFVVVEWLQPQIFPLYAGNGLVAVPLLAQTADLGGPLLLTALLAGANVLVFELWRWVDGRRAAPLRLFAIGAVVATVVGAYGWARIAAVETASARAPALRVGLVQANLDVHAKDRLGVVTHRAHLAQTRELLAASDVDLVVWPESAYVRGIRRPLPVASRPIVADVAVPLLFGASGTMEVDGRKVKSNSVFLAREDGQIAEVYDKNLLIPLAESLPFRGALPFLERLFPHAEQFAAATTLPALAFGPWRLATPICYEAVRPEFVRRMMAEARPHLLVTLANDAWFGDSQEPWLHLGLAQLRAIEHRRWLVRATNSGVSALVDPAGRIVARTGLLTRENLAGTVHPLEGSTVYARLGDWPGWLSLALVASMLVRRRDRRPKGADRAAPDHAAKGDTRRRDSP